MTSRNKQIAQINMDSLPQPRHRRHSSLNQLGTPGQGSSRQGSIDQGKSSKDASLLASNKSSQQQGSMGAQELDRRLDKEAGPSRWDEAVGNLEDARITFDRIASTLNDAIYLDEESYNQMTPVMRYTETIQAQERRIHALEVDLAETRRRLEESNAVQTEALKRHADMQQELENNAVVFNMHYEELLKKDEEIKQLNDLVEVLSSKG